MPNDDRRILFLSFAGIMQGFIDKKIGFASLSTGIFYFNCDRDTVFHPIRNGYEGPLNREGRSYLEHCLKQAESEICQPGIFKRLIYREKKADRQLRLLNILLENSGINPIEPDRANNFQEGIAVLRSR